MRFTMVFPYQGGVVESVVESDYFSMSETSRKGARSIFFTHVVTEGGADGELVSKRRELSFEEGMKANREFLNMAITEASYPEYKILIMGKRCFVDPGTPVTFNDLCQLEEIRADHVRMQMEAMSGLRFDTFKASMMPAYPGVMHFHQYLFTETYRGDKNSPQFKEDLAKSQVEVAEDGKKFMATRRSLEKKQELQRRILEVRVMDQYYLSRIGDKLVTWGKNGRMPVVQKPSLVPLSITEETTPL